MVNKALFKQLQKGDTAFINDSDGITRWFVKATNGNSETVYAQSMLDNADIKRVALNPLSTVYIVGEVKPKLMKSDFTQTKLL